MKDTIPLEISKNINGQIVGSRNGLLLCSPRDPEREANAWFDKQKLIESDKKIIVLGAGIGYHIKEIQKHFPEIKIDVLELDTDTRNELKISNVNLIEHSVGVENIIFDAVLGFRPAWAGYEKEYTDIFLGLTQRDILSEISFKLKGASFAEDSAHTEDTKLWEVLRELIL
jgi:hypothetical protein